MEVVADSDVRWFNFELLLCNPYGHKRAPKKEKNDFKNYKQEHHLPLEKTYHKPGQCE